VRSVRPAGGRRGVGATTTVAPVRVVTWNVNSLKVRLPRVEEWLATVQPDIVCLQETKLADSAFPAMAFSALGYEVAHHGEGRWNGVAIASRVGIDDITEGFGDDEPADPEARVLWATCAGIRVASVYVPNGRALDQDHYRYKLAWLGRLRSGLAQRHDPSERLLVCGDFNIAPDDRDVYDPEAFVGETHVSGPERAALRDLEAWGLVDVFRRHYDAGGLFSWWDYRAGNFHKGKGMRIDLVLATKDLADRSTAALIDRNARKGKAPSDHAPLVVDFALGPGHPVEV
jgi:exodeoxyribonuclease-3